jgi:D-ribose pyranase
MLKGGILNPQLAHILASTGHMDMLVVTDAGLPLPLGVERVDLAWKPFEPKFLDLLEEVLKHTVVEKVIIAEEVKTVSPEMNEKMLKLLPQNIEIVYVPHVQFKETTKSARAMIRSGEFTPYANIILVSGCAY